MKKFYTEEELVSQRTGTFLCDVECYPNYWLVGFKSYDTGKYAFFESKHNEPVQSDWLAWMLDNFCIVTFNGNAYDMIVISLAITGKLSVSQLFEATQTLIVAGEKPSELLKAYDTEFYSCNHIDLIEVAPLQGSLKTYAARLHCPHMQDLPYPPSKPLLLEEMAHVRNYNFNDLDNTGLLLGELSPHLELRAILSLEHGRDLRSKSDAQLAEVILNQEIACISGKYPKRQDFTKVIGSKFFYEPPPYVSFYSEENKRLFERICTAEIEIGSSGHVVCPKEIEGLSFRIGERSYTVGMGGLHSQEKCQGIKADGKRIFDRDVTGYYPNLILKNKFAPEQLGEAFLEAYKNIVDRREKAKKSGDKVTADCLKIATNGSFGKTSDPFSTLYSPRMMVQTTITGQLSLLMAIEWLTLAGLEVVSANTDGVVTLVHDWEIERFYAIWQEWEKTTNLKTEETEYSAIYSRDVNNYFAVTVDGKVKTKGQYAEFGSALNSRLSKNPENLVCLDAVKALLTKGVPVAQSIHECKDVTRFVTVRKVTGGAAKDGVYLGKTVRWYFATNTYGAIQYCKNGNKVPNSDGAKPLMILPNTLPVNLDYDKYISIAVGILEDIGFQKKRNQQLTMI